MSISPVVHSLSYILKVWGNECGTNKQHSEGVRVIDARHDVATATAVITIVLIETFVPKPNVAVFCLLVSRFGSSCRHVAQIGLMWISFDLAQFICDCIDIVIEVIGANEKSSGA